MTALLELFWLTFKIGAFTFGGGMAMVPLIQDTLVKAGLMTATEAIDVVALSQVTPGPFAVNATTFAGMRLYGLTGAAVATLGIVLPSILLMAIVARFFYTLNQKPGFKAALLGARAAVLALIASTAVFFAQDALFELGDSVPGTLDIFPPNLIAAAIAVAAFIAMQSKKVGPIPCILAAAAIGALVLR